jgi:hypothetical protein
MSWCHRFEIISNSGSVLESIENYNLLSNILHTATSPGDYRNTAGKLIDNQGSKAERNANMASTKGKMCCAGLDASGILGGNSKYLPCQFIQGVLYSASTVTAVKAVDSRHLQCFGTIFQPDDLDDIADFKLGERYKVSMKFEPEATATENTTKKTASGSSYHLNTSIDEGKTSKTKADQYLYVVGYGDVVVAHTESDGSDVSTTGFINLTGCVHFSSKALDDTDGLLVGVGGPKQATPYSEVAKIDANGVAGTQQSFGNGALALGGGSAVVVPKDNHAALVVSTAGTDLLKCRDVVVVDEQFDYIGGSKARFYWNTCVMDQVPDDSKFYIGIKFETHNEHGSMVSGTDLTNTVPLHLNLKFNSGENKINEKISNGDIITSFVHYDCILRIEPDGSTISSA